MSDIRSVCLSHLDVQLVNIFLTEAARVESTQNNTLHTNMKVLCLARSQPKTTLRVRLPPPPPTQQLLILLSDRASPQPERRPCPWALCATPNQTCHGPRRKSRPLSQVRQLVFSSELCLFWSSSGSDYHVRLSDVSEPWNVINVTFSLWGFGSGIWMANQRHCVFYQEYGQSVGNGIFAAIKISVGLNSCNFLQRPGALWGKGGILKSYCDV